jgi:bacterioferritin-associated ferredoxin
VKKGLEIDFQNPYPLFMVVCLCQGISDKTVRASIAEGARTRQQVTEACGAGDGCGTCHRTIKTLIVECRAGSRCPTRSPAYVEQAAATA